MNKAKTLRIKRAQLLKGYQSVFSKFLFELLHSFYKLIVTILEQMKCNSRDFHFKGYVFFSQKDGVFLVLHIAVKRKKK